MTIADFLYQASFWQWIGMMLVASALAGAFSHNKKDKP